MILRLGLAPAHESLETRKEQVSGNSKFELTVGGRVSGGRKSGTEGLGEGEPELERETGDGEKTRVNIGRSDRRTESKIGDAGRPLADIGGDGLGDMGAKMITKTERLKVGNGKESGADGTTNGSGPKSSVARAAGNVTESGDEFSRKLQRAECSINKSARKSKQRALRSVAA